MTSEQSPRLTASSASYRAYLIDPASGVKTVISLLAETDAAASTQARMLTILYDVEVWDRSRLVIRLPTLKDC